MPRKKKSQPSTEVDAIELQLKSFLRRFRSMAKDRAEKVSTGMLNLDYVFSGGIVRGSIMEIFGKEFSGKTTTVLALARAFRKAFPDKKVLYIDAEHALNPWWVAKHELKMAFDDLHTDADMMVIQPMSANEAMDAVVDGAKMDDVFSLVVLDSLPALMAEEEISSSLKEGEHITTKAIVTGVMPKLVTTMVRRLTAVMAESKVVVIWVNQIRANISQYGAAETTPGGYARQHAAHYRVKITAKVERTKEQQGYTFVRSRVEVVKNKHGIPYLHTDVFIYPDKGMDPLANNIVYMVESGLIQKSGPYYVIGENKLLGHTKLVEFLHENQETYEKLLGEGRKQIERFLEDYNLEV